MAILVDFGLSIGAVFPPGVFVVGSATQGILGTNTLGTVNVLADYSNRIMSISVQRTSDRSNGPLVTYNAGTATVKLLNMDAALDPYQIEAAGLTAPGVVMRIRYLWNGTVYPVFYGFVDSWNPDAEAPELGTVTVTATDGFSLLNQPIAELGSAIGAGASVSARIGAVLDAVGWPTAARAIGTSSSTMQATTYGASGLDLIGEAVEAEVGEFYQQPDGIMFFRGRNAMMTDARSATPQAVLGSNRSGGEIPYVGRPVSTWDKAQLHNTVRATIDGGTNVQTASDSASVARYGTLGVEESALKLQTDADALSWAHFVLAQDSKPVYRFGAVALSQTIEQLGVSVMPLMLGSRMGDRLTVVRRPPAQPYGSIVDSRAVYVQGIEHDWTAESKYWLTTLALTPVSQTPFFILGSSTQGVLGTNLIGW